MYQLDATIYYDFILINSLYMFGHLHVHLQEFLYIGCSLPHVVLCPVKNMTRR